MSEKIRKLLKDLKNAEYVVEALSETISGDVEKLVTGFRTKHSSEQGPIIDLSSQQTAELKELLIKWAKEKHSEVEDFKNKIAVMEKLL